MIAATLRQCDSSIDPSRERVEAALAEQQLLLRATQDGVSLVTTPSVLAEERATISFARDGRGTCRPIAAGRRIFQRDWLNADQREAVEQVLNSRDRVMVIRGGAGTGQTSLLQELAGAIEAQGQRVLAFAPSAEASRTVLRADGFATADTVARLLVDERLQ